MCRGCVDVVGTGRHGLCTQVYPPHSQIDDAEFVCRRGQGLQASYEYVYDILHVIC